MVWHYIPWIWHNYTRFTYSYSINSTTIAKNSKSMLNTNPYTLDMARASKRFCLTMLWPHSCQFTASYMQVLWCYSQNSRPMPKIGKKRHSNTLCYTLVMGKAHWLSYFIYKGLYTHQVPASYGAYLWCYSQNSGIVPKIAKKRTQIPVPIPRLLLKRIYGSV
jgi:hypothetical protein